MKLTRRGRCFQEYFSSEVTVSLQAWGGGGTRESRRSLLTDQSWREAERSSNRRNQSGGQERRKDRRSTGQLPCDSSIRVRCARLSGSQAGRPAQRTPELSVTTEPGAPRYPEPSSLLPSLAHGVQVDSTSGCIAAPSPSPSPASGCCPLIVYIPFSLCL